jgi:hypothetical protein
MVKTTTAHPTRHGADLQQGRRIAAPLRLLIQGDPEASPEQWRALGDGLLQGDPPADALAAWMREYGMSRARGLFERALERGIEADAPPPLRAFFAHIEARPAWVDPERLEAGARACGVSGLTGTTVLRDLALLAGYQASAINRTLVLTGALRDGAQRRVAETYKWWVDATAAGGTARFADGFKSTVRVRVIHAMVRHQVLHHPEWDAGAWGLPVNQTDMAVTYLGFCVVFLFGQRLMGVPVSKREGEDVMHLWRYLGWLMGVDERWLVDTEQEGRVALYQHVVAQAPPDESSKALARALMDEPLRRHYRRLPALSARFERAKHLSIQRTLLGRASMESLGLPTRVLPWYLAFSVPAVAGWHLLHRILPGGRARLARTGRAAQTGYLRVLFGEQRPAIAANPPGGSQGFAPPGPR